jgi:hypothetical protein
MTISTNKPLDRFQQFEMYKYSGYSICGKKHFSSQVTLSTKIWVTFKSTIGNLIRMLSNLSFGTLNLGISLANKLNSSFNSDWVSKFGRNLKADTEIEI